MVKDEIVPVATQNGEMNDAIDQARASIKDFFKAFNNPQPNQTGFHIKACFTEGEASEHIWLGNLDFKVRPATGVIDNDPRLEGLHLGQRVPFLPDQISDWMYNEDGKLVGGFTTQVLLRAKAKDGFRNLLRRRLVN